MKRFSILVLVLCLLLLLLTGCPQSRPAADPGELFTGQLPADKVSLLFPNLGQGDCCLLCFPSGERVMIDTGPLESRDHLLAQLDLLGVKSLDAIFVTHGHADHTGNLLTLVRRLDVKSVYYGGSPEDYGDLLKKVRRRGVVCQSLAAGDSFSFGEAVLSVLSPLPGRSYDGLNDSSAVMKLSYGDTGALFMADGTFQTEEYLLFAYGREILAADVLKVGHHGSAGSSSLRFVKVVSPALAVISVGAQNEYGHPTPETLLRLNLSGCRVLRTDESPAIQITLDGREARVVE